MSDKAIHFGVYPNDWQNEARVDGHWDREHEHKFEVSAFQRGWFTAFVSGSWACWGPADQETEGDNSLHVVVRIPEGTNLNSDLLTNLTAGLYESIGREDRLLDFALVTTFEDWSEQESVAIITGGSYLLPLPVVQ